MAYDLLVGKSNNVKDAPEIIGRIHFDELPTISRLLKRVDSFFLHRVSSFFDDQAFSTDEVEQALSHLLPLLTKELKSDELAMLHKLIAALSYAQAKKLSLYGVAD
jgi:hypothetical protein